MRRGELCSRNSLPGQWNVMMSLSTIRGTHYNASTWTVEYMLMMLSQENKTKHLNVHSVQHRLEEGCKMVQRLSPTPKGVLCANQWRIS
jgi:hypothetical protein